MHWSRRKPEPLGERHFVAVCSPRSVRGSSRRSSSRWWLAIGAVLIEIILARMIQLLTGYFTRDQPMAGDSSAESSKTGAATVTMFGMSTGMDSRVYLALLMAAQCPARTCWPPGTLRWRYSRWRWSAAAC